ncbi:extracellular serine-rich protein [Moniliophthora roreri MCA 2997]|uniref:Extracellular serine-rich protein n=1 Tax=Moniliophthora roreri (strain MCA 2997) TaxID=1381753 RepID=V2YUP6_MONRO|nr:extracellular serine-rich protein [Moniliophthora roreri MCA 2997]
MFLLSSVLSLALAGLAVAQNQTVNVNVGGVASRGENIFMFSPNTITAQVGDVVRFNFSGSPGNHSITQSTFQNPCQPMPGGFDSGWVFIPENGLPPDSDPIWNLTITNTSAPIWFFCKQLVPMPHCTTGMVGAINAPTSGDNTFQNYVSNANKDSSPGQGIGALVGNGASASAVPGPIDTSLGANYAGSPAPTPVSASGSGGASPTTTGSGSNAASQLRMDAILYLGAIAAVGLFA